VGQLGVYSTPGMLFRGLPLQGGGGTSGASATFYPFVSEVREFDWIVADAGGRALKAPQSVVRERDYYLTASFQTRSPDSPFVVEGHTQGSYFAQSSMVHGLGVFFGTSLPAVAEYQSYSFASASRWGCLFADLIPCPK
jgi:hypothetical protein